MKVLRETILALAGLLLACGACRATGTILGQSRAVLQKQREETNR